MADITITEGDTLEVDYSLENTGDGTGTFDPRLLVDGVQEDQDSGITLNPTQTATGTLEWPTESGDAVTDALAEAVTGDTSDSILVTVESAIPDSVVSRPADTGTFGTLASSGIVISPNSDFDKVGARISQNVSGATRARLYDYSSGSYVDSVDITTLSAGDAFGFEYQFIANNDYGFELDASGAQYTQGFTNESKYPYTGEDIDIVARSEEAGQITGSVPTNVNDVGNSGL